MTGTPKDQLGSNLCTYFWSCPDWLKNSHLPVFTPIILWTLFFAALAYLVWPPDFSSERIRRMTTPLIVMLVGALIFCGGYIGLLRTSNAQNIAPAVPNAIGSPSTAPQKASFAVSNAVTKGGDANVSGDVAAGSGGEKAKGGDANIAGGAGRNGASGGDANLGPGNYRAGDAGKGGNGGDLNIKGGDADGPQQALSPNVKPAPKSPQPSKQPPTYSLEAPNNQGIVTQGQSGGSNTQNNEPK
jgi:hypothetical protein